MDWGRREREGEECVKAAGDEAALLCEAAAVTLYMWPWLECYILQGL